MQRRKFMTLFGAAALSPSLPPLAARAQQGGRMRRVGMLLAGGEDDPVTKERLAVFRQGLEKLGWSEGRNVHIDGRFASANAEFIQQFAKELVALQPDVIVAHTTSATAALQRETRTIPIVFVSVSDPIGSGFVTSLARPGGNITGFLFYESSIVGKWLAMLKEIAPQLARAAFMANPKTTPYDYFLHEAAAIAPSLAIDLVPSRVETASDIEHAIESFTRIPNGGLLVLPDSTSILHRDLIIALAARHRLPAVYTARYWVTAGGLMCYETDVTDQFRQAVTYVDRIVRGDKPQDLPVQAPVKYQTVLNLKTARALGLTVPPGLLVAADEVIE